MIRTSRETVSELKAAEHDNLMDGVSAWASFYRANPHRFARDYLNLVLKPFQQIILCMFFRFTNCIYLASRGGGKSFLLAIFCVIYCILFPGTAICLASKTRTQATEIIDKIRKILMPRSANLRAEISDIIVNQSSASVTFRNSSTISVVTAGESARHNRATILIVDEYRLVNKNVIDTILRRFLTSTRHPDFLDKPEYAGYPVERTKELYASSCWYEEHWSYEIVRSYAVNMVRGRSYFCCSMPYQLAIREGILERERVEDEMSESTFDEVSFHMEMEALFFGKSEGGLYNFAEIDKNRKIKFPFYPPYLGVKLPDKRVTIPDKVPGEIRILSADIALMASTKHQNDATSIFLNQMLPGNGGKYYSNFVYAENIEGARTDAQALLLRKMFEAFQCDYLAIDGNGVGAGVLDLLLGDIYDPETGETYDALSCCNNEDIAARCMNPGARKAIWAIKGNSEFNSSCALMLREGLRQGTIRLLISEYEAEEELGKLRGYVNLSIEDTITLKLPYVHTTLLVNELIDLEYETKNKAIRVKEKPGKRKDRYSSISYNYFVAKQIEREESLRNRNRDLDPLVFEFRAPRVKKGR